MTTQTLPTINTDVNFEQIASIIGQDEPKASNEGDSLAFLRINYNTEDDNEKQLPVGYWTIATPEHGAIFSKEIEFQVFLQRYQYTHWDEEAEEMANKSIFAQNLYPQTEVPDMLGTMRCGSVPYSQREGLNAEQALKQKSIRCFRMLFGRVTLKDAVNVDGEKVEASNLPCLWRARGSNFMTISDAMDSLSAQKKPFIFYKLKSGLEKKKNGGVIYYVSNFEVSEGPLSFGEEDNNLLKLFCEYVDNENKDIMKAYDKALMKKAGSTPNGQGEVIDIDDALNDDLPDFSK
jgi:hypothetical protein